MICRSCKKKLSEIDVYCEGCGLPTENFKEQFRVRKVIRQAYDSSKVDKESSMFSLIPVILAIVAFVYLIENRILTEMYWVNYILLNAFMVFMIPLVIRQVSGIRYQVSSIKYQASGNYLKLVIFMSTMVLFFFFLKIICQGDPILNLVRMVLVCWSIAIVFPVPVLIDTRDESVFKSINRAFISGKYLRWHQFYLCFVLAVLLILLISLAFALLSGVPLFIALLLLMLPLPTFLRFSGHLMWTWFEKQDEFQLYEKNKDY